MDKSLLCALVELPAQAHDVRFDSIGKRVGFHVPYMLEDHSARQHASAIAQEVFEKHEFFPGKA